MIAQKKPNVKDFGLKNDKKALFCKGYQEWTI